jgi:hypothetical protein
MRAIISANLKGVAEMIIDGLLLMLLGVLAVPGLIIAKRPDAKQLIDKIAPYQGWIGAILALWGVFRLITWFQSFRFLGLGVRGIIMFAIYTAFVWTMIALGFMLGVGVLKTFIKDANAQAKMDQVMAKLVPKQGQLGLLALVLGGVMFVLGLFPSLLW